MISTRVTHYRHRLEHLSDHSAWSSRARQRAARECVASTSSARPALVVAAVAGEDIDQGAVRGALADDIEAQAGLDADDGAVGVDAPLLVRAAVAAPDADARARR